MRVMQHVEGTKAKTVAIMHDLLEDTAVRSADLIELGFEPEILQALLAVTKQPHENRFTAVQRTKQNALACKVKLADLADNMDLSRLKTIHSKDLKRLAQYRIVKMQLEEADQVYSFIQALNVDQNYPTFSYSTRASNYQYLLNLMFDQAVSYPAQEWWILFEDASRYLSWCKRHHQAAKLSYFLALIACTDRVFFDDQFADANTQALFKQMFEQFQLAIFKS
jgi:hypothetical protein